MDAFVTRQKKRRLKSPSPSPSEPPTTTVCDDDESTEIKLAMLASLLSDDVGAAEIDQDVLLDLLLAHDGSVAAASEAFLMRQPGKYKNIKKLPRLDGGSGGNGGVVGQQTSLRGVFASGSGNGPCSPEKKAGPATTLLSRHGRTLYLYDPVDVEAHTPCTLVHNFLPAEMANDLLRETLAEAKTFGAPYTFKLFDQVVSSPHTSCMYLDSAEEAREATAGRPSGLGSRGGGGYHPRGSRSDEKEEDDRTGVEREKEDKGDDPSKHPNDNQDPALTKDAFVLNTRTHEGYRYNGSRLSDIRTVTPHMARVKPLVEVAVNRAIQQRIATHYPGGRKLRYQNPKPWRPNAAFVNCYNGGHESVGWHSDQMTYLGPRAVIGSVSLGVAREFRVRRIVPRESAATGEEDGKDEKRGRGKKPSREDDAGGQISIHLPHNSLLVMHAEMQEEWKHCVTPAPSVEPHPIAGVKRINLTYRDYRADFHPNFTPRCRCGIAAILRVVQRKLENYGRYFWMCHAGNIPDREGCTFFQWAEFDDDGVPL